MTQNIINYALKQSPSCEVAQDNIFISPGLAREQKTFKINARD